MLELTAMNAREPSAPQRLKAAARDHSAGRLREAAAGYEELLRGDPDNADLLHRLGIVRAQLGETHDAVRLLARAVELKPQRAPVLVNLGLALHTLGRESEALVCCDRALALDPGLAGAHRLKYSVLAALGEPEQALAHIGQAVRLAPGDAGALVDLGVALEAAGRGTDAGVCFERALELEPELAPAHHNLGILAARRGEHARALGHYDRALALQPQQAAVHGNRGNALRELGRLDEAAQSYGTALALEPDNAVIRRNRAALLLLMGRPADALGDYDRLTTRPDSSPADLAGRGASLVGVGRYAEALAVLDRALALAPGDVQANVQRGVALQRLERHEDAVRSFDRALAADERLPEVWNNRGVALAALGRPTEALASFVRSAVLDGRPASTHVNAGVVLKSLGRYAEAEASLDLALSLAPDDPAARFELGFLRLALGDYRRGWPLYEARFAVPALAIPRRDFGVPRWDGRAELAGRTLLVHAEQGLGDTIQFCRYLPLLLERGASVVFEVVPAMRRIVSCLSPQIRVIARGERPPPVDFHCPLLSLPLAFDTELASIPRSVPYLHPEPDRVVHWRQRLASLPGLRVGIAWQGNPDVERMIWARGRSVPLAALAPLAEVPGVSLVSLQKGAGSEQLKHVAFRDRVLDLGTALDAGPDAFLDTAAVMEGLDLVISSDTAVAHLAGALARPVWTLLSTNADWRWLVGRSDSPWYPTMRLFRQSVRDEWAAVAAGAAGALEALASRSRTA